MSDIQSTITTKTKNNKDKTALITGANSGIGFETAAKLAEEGFGKVILACRTNEKGELAKSELVERTEKDVFEIIVVDVAEVKSANAAADELVIRKDKIDLLILNAGMSAGNDRLFNSDGVEMTFASHIVGHHVLTMRLLSEGLLPTNAHIVIAGSEGALGDFPGMTVADFRTFADEHFEGDLEQAMVTIARYQKPYDDKPMSVYVTAKVYSTWWAAVLSRKLPEGMVVNAISPGSVPGTNYARHQSFFMRRIMLPIMKYPGRFMGMAWSASSAADRYIKGGQFDSDTTGHFFASQPGKFTGKMEIQKDEHFLDRDYQDAGWKAIVNISGGVDYPTTI